MVTGNLLSTRLRWAIGGVVLALVVGALLLRHDVAHLDPGTPEGTAQGYLRAVVDGDRREALEYLTPELREACRHPAGRMWVPESARITLAGTHVDGSSAEVDVVVTRFGEPGLFGATADSHDVTLYLERSGEGWAIATAPWPLWTCEETP